MKLAPHPTRFNSDNVIVTFDGRHCFRSSGRGGTYPARPLDIALAVLNQQAANDNRRPPEPGGAFGGLDGLSALERLVEVHQEHGRFQVEQEERECLEQQERNLNAALAMLGRVGGFRLPTSIADTVAVNDNDHLVDEERRRA